MDQHALAFVSCRTHKVKDLVSNSILGVKKYLVLLVDPVVSQVGYTDALPHVSYLGASTVDDMCHFVSDNEFQILKTRANDVLTK